MRRLLPAHCLLIVLLGGCFNPDLGATPFLCAPEQDDKRCPDGYDCVGKVCVEQKDREDAAVTTGDAGPRDLQASKEGPVFLDGALVKPAPNCADKSSEPNNTGATATALTGEGFIPGWEICYPGDIDHYALSLDNGDRLTFKIKFFHKKGDLDMALVDPDGSVIRESRSEDDDETVSLNVQKKGRYVVGVYGFGTATNKYDIDLTIE